MSGRRRLKKNSKYKSKFEETFAAKYPQLQYETNKLKYTVVHTYTPDWKINDTAFIETKGLWKAADRAKYLYIREQHPDVTIYMVFQNPNNKLNRVSKTSYADYCEKHNIPWATIDTIPEEWFKCKSKK